QHVAAARCRTTEPIVGHCGTNALRLSLDAPLPGCQQLPFEAQHRAGPCWAGETRILDVVRLSTRGRAGAAGDRAGTAREGAIGAVVFVRYEDHGEHCVWADERRLAF